MSDPSFPKRYVPPRRDSGIIGNGEGDQWTTTYQSDSRPKDLSDSSNWGTASIDTEKLQSTHWRTGTESAEMVSNYKSDYHVHPQVQREAVKTRDELMASSIVLGDGRPMETRQSLNSQKVISSAAVPRTDIHQQIVGSHIALGMGNGGGADQWETTNHSSFKGLQGMPAQTYQDRFHSGDGARDAICAGYVAPNKSEMKSEFVPLNSKVDHRDFHEVESKLRKTSFQVGDVTTTTYETTNKAEFKKLPIENHDPGYAKRQKARLSESQILHSNERMPTKSMYDETFVEHKGFLPPKSNERTAFISHHDFRNCNEVFTSTSQDAFPVRAVTKTEPVDNRLRDTHVVIGEPTINENRSLYQDTFIKKTPQNNSSERRDYHHEDHIRVTNPGEELHFTTTTQASYLPHPGFKPRDPIQFSQIEHVITPADPSLTVTESTMKSTFIAHPNQKVNAPVNNSLQTSHINISGGAENQYRTTQHDYFQFKTFKFD